MSACGPRLPAVGGALRAPCRSSCSGLGPRESAPLSGFRGEPVGALRGSSTPCSRCVAWRATRPPRRAFARE
eukprot:11072885-Alexandrium_andersonii.AAC.1